MEDSLTYKDDKNLLECMKFIRDLVEKDFTGNVQLNFFKGTINNINKLESIKLGELCKTHT
jgi:hypothetical protein